LGPTKFAAARLGDGLFQDAGAVRKLAADVDVRLLHVVRPAGDHDPLDELVRVLVDDVAVLEGAGLGLVGVDDQVDGLAALAIDETPLQAAGEARAAATAQAGLLHFVDDRRRRQGERLLQRLVAAVRR
jgi:hypothetical protein